MKYIKDFMNVVCIAYINIDVFVKRIHWLSKNFRLPDFGGFTRFSFS